ncbi:mycothiol synthase [Cryobacterium sp. TMT1-21]|uniref:Mycothiol acetyltransferase n=1 Tax=Cryobacterium shii TaxID=1259235 RepID=A0AAQ2C477_9MICO|nr:MULTISPECIES: mycothiol synthase [Cryobacterium]TFC42797.1 mycothiol synthase [Cryobacterium shii]TFC89000.1 mycothiol synthase [Cryobacterium sp. TmT2-59]TFD11596.1 mycothiol synthase [Cryobacterium sp. TMT4-10]TFD14732.1 mycothiol synthase [Cryobacterium sp. TMT1-21]TFD22319.1 mycothiol synthase [Cryobacterium sp. TMT2-23]
MAFIRSATNLSDPAFAAEFDRVAAAATAHDDYQPFNEQARFDLASGRRTPFLVTSGDADTHPGDADTGVVGAGIIGAGELDLVIDPAARRLGHGGDALGRLLTDAPGDLRLWSHGDHPAARALAERFGFAAERTLLQLRKDLTAAPPVPDGADPANPAHLAHPADGIVIEAFRPGTHDADWVALNALVFASHPEQGLITEQDLAARQAESWFDAGDFLLAREAASGRLLGYNWLKVEPGSPVGEIYVIGVHPDAAGRGLGRRLMQAGLDRLRERGCSTVDLYVEADSVAAVNLYRSLGFTDRTVDVQYHRHIR